jgi:hypothetical protein
VYPVQLRTTRQTLDRRHRHRDQDPLVNVTATDTTGATVTLVVTDEPAPIALVTDEPALPAIITTPRAEHALVITVPGRLTIGVS